MERIACQFFSIRRNKSEVFDTFAKENEDILIRDEPIKSCNRLIKYFRQCSEFPNFHFNMVEHISTIHAFDTHLREVNSLIINV